jgi:hypothetical protein
VASANTSCPVAISAAPATSMRRDPKRSSSIPTGICIAAYTASWATLNSASIAAPTPNRCAAATLVTPSEERWNTAAM